MGVVSRGADTHPGTPAVEAPSSHWSRAPVVMTAIGMVVAATVALMGATWWFGQQLEARELRSDAAEARRVLSDDIGAVESDGIDTQKSIVRMEVLVEKIAEDVGEIKVKVDELVRQR